MSKHKEQKQLTIEQLRKFEGFENINDAEAQHVLDTLEKLSLIIYDLYVKKKLREERLINNDLLKDKNQGDERHRKAA